MTRIESELHDLCECLMRNDDMADRDTYHTIVGIANDVAEVESENAKLRGIVCDLHKALFTLDIDHCQACPRDNINGPCTKFAVWGNDECSIEEDMRELGIEVNGR